MRYTVNLDCKTHYVSKNGTVPLTLRISVNGEHDYLNTGKRIKVTQYDLKTKSIKPGINGHTQLTSFITRQKKRVDEIMEAFEKHNEVATIAKVKEQYAQETGKVKSTCFYEYVADVLKWEREHSDLSEDTLDNYEIRLRKMKDYRAKLSIHDINAKFIEEYRSYILNILKQAPNTAYFTMIFLRKYVKKLFDDGKISIYPFTKVKVGSPHESEIQHLEPEELTRLHDLYDSGRLKTVVRQIDNKITRSRDVKMSYGDGLQNVLRYFLVGCYTGLRHSDIKTLKKEHIKGSFVVKEMVKGRKHRKKTVRIPIRKRLLSLIDTTGDVLFENPVMECAATNICLKRIMKEAGINKHITFHCARHSFAIISLLLGIKIEVVSDILGHSALTTTQRYAKVVDKLREQEMDKWDKLAKVEFINHNQHEINCPGCDNTLLRLEKSLISLVKLPMTCPYCDTHFSHNLKTSVSEINHIAVSA